MIFTSIFEDDRLPFCFSLEVVMLFVFSSSRLKIIKDKIALEPMCDKYYISQCVKLVKSDLCMEKEF